MDELPELYQELADLKRKEEMYHTLLSTIPDLVCITDLKGVVQFINEAGVRLSGFSKARDILGHNILDFVVPSQREIVLERLKNFDSLSAGPFEFLLRSPFSAEPVPFEIIRNILRDPDNHPTGFVYICRDIRQRKDDALQIKRHSRLLQGVSEAIAAMLMEDNVEAAMNKTLAILGESTRVDRVYLFRNHVDPEGKELLVSQIYEWTNGTVSVELHNPDLQNIRYTDLPDMFYRELSHDRIVTGLASELSGLLKEILDAQQVLSVLLVPVMIGDGFWGFVGFDDCHTERIWSEADISVLKAAAAGIGGAIYREGTHRELETAYLKAEESDRLKSSLLANMSHEFRTPMTGILGFAEMIYNESESSDIKQMGAYILTSAKRLMNTLDAMIKLSEIESGLSNSDLNQEQVELNTLILSCISDSVFKASRKNLPIEFRKADPLYVVLDPNYTKQILNHLLDNAIKFTQQGEIRINTGIQTISGTEMLVISVSDTGIGIPSEYHQTIFHEFRQVSEGLGRHHEGSGLGLTIAGKIADLLGGTITLNSEPGRGSTFNLCLPYIPWTPGVESPKTILHPFSQNLQDYSLSLEKNLPEILLVEDNDVNIQLVMAYLRGICKVDYAMYGLKAVQMSKVNSYRLILMDINLGAGMDGLETAREIRKIPGYQNTPIVAVTGFTLLGERDRLLEGGCTHYIPKPFDKNSLVELCLRILNE